MARIAWNEFEGLSGISGGSISHPLTHGKARSAVGYLIGSLRRALRIIALWRDREAQRRALAELDDRLLRDIGITRIDAQHESAKPFWR